MSSSDEDSLTASVEAGSRSFLGCGFESGFERRPPATVELSGSDSDSISIHFEMCRVGAHHTSSIVMEQMSY